MTKQYGQQTHGIHGAMHDEHRSAVFPIYQTSTFGTEQVDDLHAIFAGEREGYVYSRAGNPTVRNVASKLAKICGAEACTLYSSGMAAISTAVLASVNAGDKVVCGKTVYGGTHRMMTQVLPMYGIESVLLDAEELYNLGEHAPDAKLVYFETPTNPTCEILDIARIVASAKAIGATVMMDNTFASPVNQLPLALGVDIEVHSVTKYLGGHSDIIAGAVLCDAARMEDIEMLQMVLGGIIAPFDAFLLDRSLKTLSSRVQHHNETALQIAHFLADHPKVEKIYFPGLEGSAGYEVAKKQMRGFSGMMAFEIAGGHAAALRFSDSLQLALSAVSLGSVETLVNLPSMTTHQKLSDEELEKANISKALVRLSIGLEEVDDLLTDIGQALQKA